MQHGENHSSSDEAAIQYQPVTENEHEVIRQFLASMGWEARVADPARFDKMMRNADRTVVAWSEGAVVGFGRALCDDASNGYISMLVVAPEQRGRGIGREIVRRLMGDDPEITWALRAGRESCGFWERMGFSACDIAMARPRAR